MFEQLMRPDLPNQMYAELVRIRGHERLARRLARELKAQKQIRRAAAGPDGPRSHSTHLKISYSPRQA